MKKIILTKFEFDTLILLLEELYNYSSDETVSDDILLKLGETIKLFNLEMEFYNIRSDKQLPTKKQMVKWLLSKIKAKSLDL